MADKSGNTKGGKLSDQNWNQNFVQKAGQKAGKLDKEWTGDPIRGLPLLFGDSFTKQANRSLAPKYRAAALKRLAREKGPQNPKEQVSPRS